jgi:hypothetical protein
MGPISWSPGAGILELELELESWSPGAGILFVCGKPFKPIVM